jgi:hypothetical protein
MPDTSDRSSWRPLDGSPGFYVDADGVLHVDEDEAIRGSGHLPTPRSRRALRAALRGLGRQGIRIEEVDE